MVAGPAGLGTVAARGATTRSTTRDSPTVAIASNGRGGGWRLLRSGLVTPFAGAAHLAGHGRAGRAARPVALGARADGRGYWTLTASGAVTAFGAARTFGPAPTLPAGDPAVGIVSTPDSGGYWLLTARGDVIAFGDARRHGRPRPLGRHDRAVALAPTRSGRGYWIATADGTVDAYGDAAAEGARTARVVAGPVVGLAASTTGSGYWVASRTGAVRAADGATAGPPTAPGPLLDLTATATGYDLLARTGRILVVSPAPARRSTPTQPTTGGSGPGPTGGGGTAPASADLQVVGNQLVTGTGQPVHLHGVNRSGTEYACSEGWGIFDGPSDQASIAAMATWNVNAVRVPLNEDCWLGINGVDPAYSGAAYRAAVEGYVRELLAADLAVVLDLHLTAPGTAVPSSQAPMPDAEHSVPFWSSVASTFAGTAGVAFEVYNEPRDVDWSCWQDGCSAPGYQDGSVTVPAYQAAGMQQLIDAVRATGATQPILVEGLDWGSDLSGWSTHPLDDPDHQLVAAWHVYDTSGCNVLSCWDQTILPVAASVPVVITEFGETDCQSSFVEPLMDWADAHGIGYLAWTWDTWSGCGGPSLISSYDGSPTTFGAGVQAHYLSLAAGP